MTSDGQDKVLLVTCHSSLVTAFRPFVDNASNTLLIFVCRFVNLAFDKTFSVRREKQPVSLEQMRATHRARRAEIRARLAEFAAVGREATDARLWEELVFCIFTAGASARMGLRSIAAVRPLLSDGSHEDLARALTGVHR